MRIRVQLKAQHLPLRLPLNYNYHLTALIYHLLSSSSRDYSTFLHDEGYQVAGKHFKLFTFSQLRFRRFRLAPPEIIALEPQVNWQITSPVQQFIQHLADGLLSLGKLQIAGASLQVERVEALAPPRFSPQMKLTCLSPLVASTGGFMRAGKLMAHYYRYDEPGLSEALRANLLRKHALLHGAWPTYPDLTLKFDQDYIARKGGKVCKLIDFKGTKIKGILAPFTIEGSPELIALGYEAGLGEKNSMGFGMVQVSDCTWDGGGGFER